MARAIGVTSAKHTHKRQKQSLKEANASGYAKRQFRKAKSDASVGDVYEYEPGTSRRSKVRLELDKDESKDFGIGSDGEIGDDVDKEALRARLIGEAEEEEEIASGDDEDIDSDGAFEESDEERFGEFFSNKKGKGKEKLRSGKAVRFADVDLNEDDNQLSEGQDEVDEDDEDDEEMEDDIGNFINLVDVLDGKGDTDMVDDKSAASKRSFTKEPALARELVAEDEDIDRESEGVEDDSSTDQGNLDFTPSDDETVPGALDELENFVTSLETSDKKRKDHPEAAASTSQEPKRKKRQIIKERTEAGAENEFRAQTAGSKLQLEDLLAPLASQSSALQNLKKSTKALTSTSSKYGRTLSAPLPQRSQERLDREAAYEHTKEEVDKWKDTMKRIREAEHLSFPLQGGTSIDRPSTLELAAKFKPSNELESSVDALLRAANMRDESDLVQAEDRILLANKVTLEEVADRRAELRKMRELVFRAELKARRINKIKSKTYRRLKRKEKEKLTELSRNEEEDEGEDERMKRERARAMERATLRHKHTGKWARQMKARGDYVGEDQRREMEDMLARGEKLRQKIQGARSDEEEEESDEEGAEGSMETIRQSAFDELQRVDEQVEQVDENVDVRKRSVFNMKFMKEAMAREMAKTDKLADDFLKELGADNIAASDAEKDHNGIQEDPSSGVITERVGGRLVFRPGAKNTVLRPARSLASDTSSVTLKSTDLPSPSSSSGNVKHAIPTTDDSHLVSTTRSEPSTEDSNPWLTRPEAMEVIANSSRKNEAVVSKDSKAAEKSKNKLRKLASKQGDAKDDATLVIETEKVLTVPSSVTVSATKSSSSTPVSVTPRSGKRTKIVGPNETDTKTKTKNPTTQNVGDPGNESDDNSEVEAQERALEARTKGLKSFQQRDLVALAFAGDDVVQQFEETKLREISADAPKEVDTTIPGWGTWGGTGIRKAPPKPSRIQKIAGIDPTTRADHNKNHVIISERRDKKAAKYMVKDLPFPYTSKAQFERSIQNPLGAQWNTRVGFQRATLPRVVTKPGVIITPLRKFS